MTRAALAGLALLSGCVTAKSVECEQHGGPTWHSAKTSNFRVRGNVSASEIVAQAETLEHVLAAIGWAMDYDGNVGGIDAYVVGRDHLKRFEYDVVGVAHGSLFVTESNGYRDLSGLIPNTATHELAHVVAGRAFPSIPRWLNEGLAAYLETAKLTDPKHIKIGAGIWSYQLRLLGGDVATLDELWAWGTQEEPKDEQRYRLYATSWAYVHYLSNHEREKFVTWLKRLREGKSARSSFESIFPRFGMEQAPAAIQHMNGGTFVSATLTLSGTQKAKASEMSSAAVHLARRKLWSLAFRVPDDRRAALMKQELELAKAVQADDSAETLGELLALDVITEDQFFVRARKRPDVLRAAALAHDVGTPRGQRVLEAALQAADRDPTLLALRVLEITGENEEEAERRLGALEPLRDQEGRMVAAQAAAALLRCEQAQAFLKDVQVAEVRSVKWQVRELCGVKPVSTLGPLSAALKQLQSALSAAHRLAGAGSAYRLKIAVRDDVSVTVEPRNSVLQALVTRVLVAAGVGTSYVPTGATELVYELN